MTDTPNIPKTTSRLPDWWRTKPDPLPTHEPATSTNTDTDSASADGWWDDLYDGTNDWEPQPAKETHAKPASTGRWTPQPDYWPRPHMPSALTTAPDRATAAISHGTRRLLYNATAAGAGWALGLYPQFARAIADCGSESIGGAIVLGTGGCLLIAHLWDRRTRHWWPGIAWVARIPLATAVLALALWAPAAP